MKQDIFQAMSHGNKFEFFKVSKKVKNGIRCLIGIVAINNFLLIAVQKMKANHNHTIGRGAYKGFFNDQKTPLYALG
jgi:hypothetical protein